MVFKNKPLISVIMCAWNEEKFIETAIKSILNQTYRNFELIIVESNSPDKTAKIIKKYTKIDKRIKPIFLKKRTSSIAAARNLAIKNSKGEFYATADADDYSIPSRLETQLKFMEKYTGCEICGSWFTKTKYPGTAHDGDIQYRSWHPKDIENELHFRNSLSGPSNFIRAKTFHLLGGYDEKLKVAEDYDLHVKALKLGMELRAVPKVLVHYRVHSESITHNVPPTPWKNPLNLGSAWDAKVSSLFFDVPINEIYDVQYKWINNKLENFLDCKQVILFKGEREAIFVPHFLEWVANRKIDVEGIISNGYYCGIKPIKRETIKNYLKKGYKFIICSQDKIGVNAANFLESLGAKVWVNYIHIVPYLTRLVEIEAAKKYKKHKYNVC